MKRNKHQQTGFCGDTTEMLEQTREISVESVEHLLSSAVTPTPTVGVARNSLRKERDEIDSELIAVLRCQHGVVLEEEVENFQGIHL